MQEKKKIQKIIRDLSKKINKVDTEQKVGKIVKQIDILIQECYLDLYKIFDIKQDKKIESEKKGHCC